MIFFHFEVNYEDIRKHVDDHVLIRLLAFWELWHARDDKLPLLSPERRASLRWCRANLSELAREPNGDWLYESFGEQTALEAGYNLSGIRVSELPAALANYEKTNYDRMHESKEPLYVTLRTSITRTRNTWEHILLPFQLPDGGFCVLVYSLPVSQRYQLISGILDSTTDGLLTLTALRDETNRISDFVIEDANQAAISLFGGVTADVVNAQLSEDFSEIYNSNFFRVTQHTTETGQPVRAEMSFTINGQHRWLRVAAAKSGDGAVVTFTDVTESKKRQAVMKGRVTDLSRRHALAKAVYQVAPVMLCIVNDEGVIVEANKAWLAKLGLSRSQTIGLPIVALFNQKNYVASGANVIQDVLAEGEVTEQPVELLKRDGTPLTGLLSSRVVSEGLDGMWQAVISVEQNNYDSSNAAIVQDVDTDENPSIEAPQRLKSTKEIFLPDY